MTMYMLGFKFPLWQKALQLNLFLITYLRLRNNKDGQFSKNQPVFKTVVTARVKISWFNN